MFPPVEWLKYNTDAAKNKNNNNTDITYIYRNTDGTILVKNARSIGDTPILVTEVLAIREVVNHARFKKTPRFIIENNSLTTIQEINDSITPPSLIENLVEDIKNLALQIEHFLSILS